MTCLLAGAAGGLGTAAGASVPLTSALATASASWAVVPMGRVGDPSNTFWQLVRAGPLSGSGPAAWSVVTPPGAADTGGLAAGVSGDSEGSVLAGVLANGLLRFSPLALSSDAGTTWGPVFLPGALAARPDALADGVAGGPSLALLRGGGVLRSGPGATAWTALVSSARLRALHTGCAVSGIDAVAVLGDGAPAVATGCARGGRVGVFVEQRGAWTAEGPILGGPLAGSSTHVLRLERQGGTITALVSATKNGRRWLVGLWRSSGPGWAASPPLALGASTRVRATSVDQAGGLALLLSTGRELLVTATTAADPATGAAEGWARLPAPPTGTVALAPSPPAATTPTPTSFGRSWPVEALRAQGTALDVYALTPAGVAWSRVQSIRVPLAYGSSS